MMCFPIQSPVCIVDDDDAQNPPYSEPETTMGAYSMRVMIINPNKKRDCYGES